MTPSTMGGVLSFCDPAVWGAVAGGKGGTAAGTGATMESRELSAARVGLKGVGGAPLGLDGTEVSLAPAGSVRVWRSLGAGCGCSVPERAGLGCVTLGGCVGTGLPARSTTPSGGAGAASGGIAGGGDVGLAAVAGAGPRSRWLSVATDGMGLPAEGIGAGTFFGSLGATREASRAGGSFPSFSTALDAPTGAWRAGGWAGGRLRGAAEPCCWPRAEGPCAAGLADRGGSVLEADGIGSVGKEASGGGPDASTWLFATAGSIGLPTGGIKVSTLSVPLGAPGEARRAGGWTGGRLGGGLEPPRWPVAEGSRGISATGSIGSRAGPDFWSPGLFAALGGGIAPAIWSRTLEEAWERSARSSRCRARVRGRATFSTGPLGTARSRAVAPIGPAASRLGAAGFGGESPCEDFKVTPRGLSVPKDGSAEPTGGIGVAAWAPPVKVVRAESVPGGSCPSPPEADKSATLPADKSTFVTPSLDLPFGGLRGDGLTKVSSCSL